MADSVGIAVRDGLAPRGRRRGYFRSHAGLGAEGIVSKHREHPGRAGPSKAWLKVKNPAAPGVLRFEDRT